MKFMAVILMVLGILVSIANFISSPSVAKAPADNGWDAIYVPPPANDCWTKYKVNCIIVYPPKK